MRSEIGSGRLVQFPFGGAFFEIEDVVGGGEQFIDGLAIVGVDRRAGTDGDRRVVAIGAQALGNSIGNTKGVRRLRFGENEHEFVASVTRRGVHGAAMNAKKVCPTADGFWSPQMA